MNSHELSRLYASREIIGWEEFRTPGIAKQQFDLLNGRGVFVPFRIVGQTRETSGQKVFLHWVTTKYLQTKTVVKHYYPQLIGDCVSHGARHATEVVNIIEIAQKGEHEKHREVFAPYYYGTGRVYVGGNRIGGDGSLGSWMAEAVQKYGTLFADEPDVPQYSANVAKQWGSSKSVLDKWKPKAESFPVKGVAQINSWDELVAAIVNGYPCPTASDVGYSMEASSDGFHKQTTSWAHQMCFIGADDTYKSGDEPYALLLNSWGEDAHGRLKDFETGDDLPPGILRVRRKDAEKHIRAGETYAYSNFNGFPEQLLNKSLFMLV